MFNKKTENSYFPEPSTGNKSDPQTTPAPEISIATPASDTPAGKPSNSIIDEWLTMKGDLESEGDILVKGTIRGNVRCRLLIVDEKAIVDGGMIAEEVIIRGRTEGTIRANRVVLAETSHVASEIFHRSFSVEEGARIEGALHFQDDPLKDLAPTGADLNDKPDAAAAAKTVKSGTLGNSVNGASTASG
ncbi:MAG: bactofilin family protein [Hyphomicrobiaceae bacterium]